MNKHLVGDFRKKSVCANTCSQQALIISKTLLNKKTISTECFTSIVA